MSKKLEPYIKEFLVKNYGKDWKKIYENSTLIQYLNLKAKLY